MVAVFFRPVKPERAPAARRPLSFPRHKVYKGRMKEFTDDQNCFVCGKKNTAGLGLEFGQNAASGETEARVAFPVQFQGWRSTVHGGLLATVLDEAMIKAAAAAGNKCVTAEITVKYRKPVLTGEPCLVAARIWLAELTRTVTNSFTSVRTLLSAAVRCWTIASSCPR